MLRDSPSSTHRNSNLIESNKPPESSSTAPVPPISYLPVPPPPTSLPTTPPSTPTESSDNRQSETTLGGSIMLAITRSKLEAFSGSSSSSSSSSRGRRVAPSLRQIVLLSNVFGKSQWEEEENRRREMEELDKKRSLQETQWLDGLLEEMAEQEEEDEEEEEEFYRSRAGGGGYQNRRNTGKVDDSGFLESHEGSNEGSSQAVAGPSSSKNLAFIEEEDLSSPLSPRSRSISPPTPPSPCRSPPIDVPPRRSKTSIHHSNPSHPYSNQQDLEDDYSYSPPLHPPALTPDHSPPGSGAADDLSMGAGSNNSSYDSIDREMDHFLERGRHTWIPENEYGIPDSALEKAPRTPTSSTTIDLQESFNRLGFPSVSSSIPSPAASTSLALTLIPKPSLSWLPPTPTPRHLSLSPSLPLLPHPSPPVKLYPRTEIVKYYDSFDFSYAPLDALWPVGSDEADLGVGVEKEKERGKGREEALVLSSCGTPSRDTSSSSGGNWVNQHSETELQQERAVEIKGRVAPWRRSRSHEARTKTFWEAAGEGEEGEVD